MLGIVEKIKQEQVYFARIIKGKVSLFFCRSPPVGSTWKSWVDGRFF